MSQHLQWMIQGVQDSLRWSKVVEMALNDLEIRNNAFKSLLLNSLCLASIYGLDLVLPPMLHVRVPLGGDTWLHQNIERVYQIFWVMPVVGASLYLNGTWCKAIAKRTFTLKRGRSFDSSYISTPKPQYRSIMITISLIFATLLGFIPWIGPVLRLVYLSWINSYFLFEFIWLAQGLSLDDRTSLLEKGWAYFLGFGLLPTALCSFSSSLASSAIFALILPAFVILAMFASPMPSSQKQFHHAHPRHNRVVSEFVNVNGLSPRSLQYHEIRLPIFVLVIALSDKVAEIINLLAAGRLEKIGRDSTEAIISAEEGVAVSLHLADLRHPSKAGPKLD